MWKKRLKDFWLCIIFLGVRALLSLRYRVEVKGFEDLVKKLPAHSGGILFLPNHPAEVDPLILMGILWKKFRPRPLVVEHFYYLKGARFFMDLVGALPLPNMDLFANRWKVGQVRKLSFEVMEALKRGENFLIYPSGKLKMSGSEIIGGASLVHSLLREVPEANVVLIRTSGLWGSRFSRALTGKVPSFGRELLRGAWILLKNGFFFAPRRRVTVEMESAPGNFPYKGERLEFNRHLEEWYNRYPQKGAEPLTFVSYAFWKEDFPQVLLPKEKEGEKEEFSISPEMRREILSHLASLSRRPVEEIQDQMQLSTDLGLDSLDIAQLYVLLEEQYGVVHLQMGELQSVEDFLKAGGAPKKKAPLSSMEKMVWPPEGERLPPLAPRGKTLQEAFLLSCERMGGKIACMDRLSGAFSYRKFRRAALVLSLKIKQLPGKYIGVLLPCSNAAYLVVFGCLLAKKVPVMLNWTAGVRALDHGVELLRLCSVLSSRHFLSRLDNGELGRVEDLLLYLEELKGRLSWKEKVQGLWLSLKGSASLLEELELRDQQGEDEAVVLFTSGTESLPKAVPLSHQNLLGNMRAGFSCVPFEKSDILYGVLPPFHSFGFSVTGIMPLLLGLKACYGPDPTDAQGLSRDIAEWRPTLFCSAPSFIKALFRIADPGALSSVRLFVSGAEKTPLELFDYVKQLGEGIRLLEGYGITECGPIVTLDRLEVPHTGVGFPLPGVGLCIIDPDSLFLLPEGMEGEICIDGPSVFSGYLGAKTSPFIEINGRKWYRSGDRGYLGKGGALILSGRIKRFVKIGGEMVSLAGLEEELIRLSILKKWNVQAEEKGPSLALSVREKESDKPLIVLFTTFDLSKDEANAALKECGFGRIVKVAEVRRLKEIPLTGTGKTHYRLLDELNV